MSDLPTRISIRAPAKINLGLRVLGKRPDGYHDLETLFVAVSLYDELAIERRDEGGIEFACEMASDRIPDGEFEMGDRNLIVRAVREFERETGASLHLRIRLRKLIPIAAGLGGGSSDAAATLVALANLFPDSGRNLDLASLAIRLGSDVPFFLGPPAAMGRGRGELLIPASIDLSWYAILICPRVPSRTPDVFAALDLTSLPKMSDFPARLEGDGFFAALALIHNDLQDVVARRVPEVLYWHKRLLTLGAEGAYVSGSGPSVFGIFREKPNPAMIAAIRTEGVDAWVVRPLDTMMTLVIGLS